MQFSPIHAQRGGGIPFWIFSDQFDGIPSYFSVFFLLKSTSEVSQKLKLQFSPIHTQRGGDLSFWIFSDQFNKIPIAGYLQHIKKHITTYISNLLAPATPLLLDWSMMRNILSLQIFTVLYKPLEHSPLGSLFPCCLKKRQKIWDLTLWTALVIPNQRKRECFTSLSKILWLHSHSVLEYKLWFKV